MLVGYGVAACDDDRGTTQVGTAVTLAAAPEPITIDSFQTLWRDEALGRPNLLAYYDGALVVGDRDRLHFLSSDGSLLGTVGRAGEGPEEFGSIAAIHASSEGIVVLDTRNTRHAFVSWEKEFVGTQRINWPQPYVNPPRDGDPVGTAQGGLVRFARENVSTTRPTRAALIWQSLARDSTRILYEWDDVEWASFEDVLGAQHPLGPRAVVGVAPDGSFAYGDGLNYCYTLVSPFGTDERRFCRDRGPEPVGGGARSGSVEEIPNLEDLEPSLRVGLAAALERQTLGSHYPTYDALRLSQSGAVWLRLMGADQPDVHPTLLFWLPAAGPTHRTWESVYETGAPGPTIRLPTSFDVRVFLEGVAYGFGELASGELVVAQVSW